MGCAPFAAAPSSWVSSLDFAARTSRTLILRLLSAASLFFFFFKSSSRSEKKNTETFCKRGCL